MSLQLEDPRVIEFDVRTDEMLVNMGPQHPSTHGVLRLLLKTDGEVIHEVDIANCVRTIAGVDQLKQTRANLGM